MSGFEGLTQKRFQGDEALARAYVGDLGRASYFYRTKPVIAINSLKWVSLWIPELFLWENGQVIDIAWKSDHLKTGRGY